MLYGIALCTVGHPLSSSWHVAVALHYISLLKNPYCTFSHSHQSRYPRGIPVLSRVEKYCRCTNAATRTTAHVQTFRCCVTSVQWSVGARKPQTDTMHQSLDGSRDGADAMIKTSGRSRKSSERSETSSLSSSSRVPLELLVFWRTPRNEQPVLKCLDHQWDRNRRRRRAVWKYRAKHGK